MRTAVAAALACEPAVLILDEPTSGQDRLHIDRMMEALRRLLVDSALVFATHDLDLALRHATRVVHIHEGRIVGNGPPRQVLFSLPTSGPLVLPALAVYCREHDLPYRAPEILAGEAT